MTIPTPLTEVPQDKTIVIFFNVGYYLLHYSNEKKVITLYLIIRI